MARILIDGSARDAPEGTTVLHALRALGVDVPTLCNDDRLRPQAVCRMCVVEWGDHLVPSCSTVVLDGMVLRTRTPRIDAARRTAELLLEQRPRDHWVDDSHPYIHIDMSLCIDCRRCVRICDEVQGQTVWHVFGRGSEIRVRPDGPSLAESSCGACGACVTTCPTSALSDVGAGEGDARTRTTCPYCGVGCELDVRTSGGRIVRVLPVLDAPVNKGHLCSKGRYAFGFVGAHGDEPAARPEQRARLRAHGLRAVEPDRPREARRRGGSFRGRVECAHPPRSRSHADGNDRRRLERAAPRALGDGLRRAPDEPRA